MSKHGNNLSVLEEAPSASPVLSGNGVSTRRGQTSAAWLREALEKLAQFRALPENWDSYGAEPPNENAAMRAEAALRILHRLNSPPDRLAASAEGGITLSFFHGKKYGDLEFFNTGETLVVTSNGIGTPEVWEVAEDNASLSNALEKIRDFVR